MWRGEGGALSRALVAAGGLVGPAVAAAVGFAVGRTVSGAQYALTFIEQVGVL